MITHLINSETKIVEHPGATPLFTVMKRRTMCLIPYWTAIGCYFSMEEARGHVC